MKSKILITLLTAGVLSAAATLQAVPITPGTTVVPPQGAINPPAGATLVGSLLGSPFTGQNTFNGTVDSRVYTNDSSNPFGANFLTFVYQFHITAGAIANDSVQGFSVGGFGNFLLDVVQTTPGANQHAADSVSRSVSFPSTTIGNVLNWNFQGFNAVQVGQDSVFLFVRTNATTFRTGTATAQDGSAGNAFALVPNAVPEGGSLLSVFGIVLIAGEALRRKLRIA